MSDMFKNVEIQNGVESLHYISSVKGLSLYLQGVCRQSAKAKLKNRHFTGGYRSSKPFFLTLQTGLKFPVDKRSIKDA